MNTFIQTFVSLADDNDKQMAKRVAKTLEDNGIDSIERLINADPIDIQTMKGIGDRALAIIGKIRLKEYVRIQKIKEQSDVHKKHVTLKDWILQTGCPYLEACNIEHILRFNGLKTVDDFMNTDLSEIGSWKGIGAKRLQTCLVTKGIIQNSRKKSTNP